MRSIPILESARLRIRPFQNSDLPKLFLIKQAIGWVNPKKTVEQQRAAEADYLAWSVMNERELASLGQPPYGDRAIILKENAQLIGSVGLVPCVDVYGQLPSLGGQQNCLATAEVGLLWLIHPAHQGKGYATEATQTLINYAFGTMQLNRLIATTEHDNLASQAVMLKLGMTVERNPFPDPPWLQVVGILENTAV
ncbi:GNAT family N-acetyltransferase [Candidatus Leptofilum sp.]|uniref:GNAT family N-acetyltransferase n=1 Tax=Candidatus Leptofilum sp. TaxID=3241576 RepID=UPI003B5AAFC0